jgi:hypothetical protein
MGLLSPHILAFSPVLEYLALDQEKTQFFASFALLPHATRKFESIQAKLDICTRVD